jgi:hypothetical protein
MYLDETTPFGFTPRPCDPPDFDQHPTATTRAGPTTMHPARSRPSTRFGTHHAEAASRPGPRALPQNAQLVSTRGWPARTPLRALRRNPGRVLPCHPLGDEAASAHYQGDRPLDNLNRRQRRQTT